MSEQTTPLQVHEVLRQHIGTRQTVATLNGDSATGLIIGINHEADLIDDSTIGSPMFTVAAGITTTITLFGPRSEGLHRLTISETISHKELRERHA